VKPRQAERLALSLNEQRADAALYKTLATLRFDAPVSESFESLRWRGVRRREFVALCSRLGFGEIATRPTVWAD
jgi:hypothetical protein